MKKIKLLLNFGVSLSSLAFAFSLWAPTAHADDTVTDHGVWTAIFVRSQLTDKLSLVNEIQNRTHEGFSSDSTKSNRLLVRPGVRYDLNPHWQLWGGYAWTPNFSPYKNENRIWQQVLYQTPFADLWLYSHRLRLEQREIAGTTAVAHRVRTLARVHRWHSEERKWGFVAWDEYFYNMNTVRKGPQNGFDQNRLFLGMMLGIGSDKSGNNRLEVGYLNLLLNPANPAKNVMAHILGLYAFLDF